MIDGIKIGHDNPCFIIAEVGINHNGDLTVAKKLIDAAVDSGANAVKFQKRNFCNKVLLQKMELLIMQLIRSFQ